MLSSGGCCILWMTLADSVLHVRANLFYVLFYVVFFRICLLYVNSSL